MSANWRTSSLWIFFAMALVAGVAGAEEPTAANTVGQAVNLGIGRDLNAQGTQCPIIATSASGRIYVLWRFSAAETAEVTAGIPLLPAECTFPALHPEFASIPGVSIFDGKSWSKPQRLAAGVRDCEAVAAWCDGEDLHLLVTATFKDDVGHHLRYDTSRKQWERLATLPQSPSNASRFVQQGKEIHVAGMHNGVAYWRFDGKAWSQPLPLGGEPRDGSAVVVDADGVVHVCWHPIDGGTRVGYAQIKNGVVVRQFKTELPIHGDEFDVAVGPGGHLLIAYQAEGVGGEAGGPARDAVLVRSWSGEAWSDPVPIGQGTGLVLGSIRMVAARIRSPCPGSTVAATRSAGCSARVPCAVSWSWTETSGPTPSQRRGCRRPISQTRSPARSPTRPSRACTGVQTAGCTWPGKSNRPAITRRWRIRDAAAISN